MSVLARIFRTFGKKCFRSLSILCGTGQSLAQQQQQQQRRIQPSVSVDPEIPEPSSLPPVNYITVPFGTSSSRVGFIDVGPREGPVVVALHGAPGGLQEFVELFDPLASKGFRVVVPEFPGFGRSTIEKEASFDGSTEARATYVTNFLTALDINSVTTLIGHSMGVVTAFSIAANNTNIKSLVYLNGIGFTHHSAIRPYSLLRILARLLENSLTGGIVKYILSYAYSLKGFKADAIVTGMNRGVIAASRIGFDKFRENASRLKEKRLPIFFTFTQNDRLVEWQIPMEVVRYFEVPEENISWLDSNETVVKGPSISDASAPFPWVMIFERGGHSVHRSHQSIVCQRIASFVTRVHSS